MTRSRRFLLFLAALGLAVAAQHHPVPSWRWLVHGAVWSLAIGFVMYMLVPAPPEATDVGKP
jgi:uncharacterized membrane protein